MAQLERSIRFLSHCSVFPFFSFPYFNLFIRSLFFFSFLLVLLFHVCRPGASLYPFANISTYKIVFVVKIEEAKMD